MPSTILVSCCSPRYPECTGTGILLTLFQHDVLVTGRQFDKTGRLTDWWTKGTIKRYEKLTQCIVDQYAKFFIVGPDGKKYHVNVSLHLFARN